MNEKRLLALVAQQLGVPEAEVTGDSTSDTLSSWDSQSEVELALMLEFEFGITVDDDELGRMRSVREIRALLIEKGVAVL